MVLGSLSELGQRESKPVWLAIGMFDGVHLGHRAVLNLATEKAGKEKDMVAALTFPEHPAKSLRPGKEPPLIMDPQAKSEALLGCGIHYVVMKPFDESLSEVSCEGFLGYLKEKVPSLRGICVGENFHFGKGRRGNAPFLSENGLLVSIGRYNKKNERWGKWTYYKELEGKSRICMTCDIRGNREKYWCYDMDGKLWHEHTIFNVLGEMKDYVHVEHLYEPTDRKWPEQRY